MSIFSEQFFIRLKDSFIDLDDKISNVKTCFDSYEGKQILSVKRNGLVLSTIMQKL